MQSEIRNIIKQGLSIYPIPHKSAEEAHQLEAYVSNAIASADIDTKGLSAKDFAWKKIRHYYGELIYED